MTFRKLRQKFQNIIFVSLVSLALAALSGFLFGEHLWWSVFCFVVSAFLLLYVVKSMLRLKRQMNYLVGAAVNGDFSYRFPIDGVPLVERETNVILNSIVDHLENLSMSARQDEVFLNRVINLVDIGIIVADSKGDVRHVNKAALHLLSLPALTNVCRIDKSSTELSIKTTAATLRGEKHTIYTITDMRRTLQAAEVESWEKLTRVLTHEIMNSLTPVNSIAESLSKSQVSEELSSSLGVISDSARSLMQFVKNFRKFSVLPEPRPKVFYLKPFLEKILSLARNYDNAAEVTFKLSVFPPDTMIYTDETMLNRVLMNIVKNAVEASPATVSISSEICSDESVEIVVCNDGNLIPEEIVSQIFTPFYTTRKDGSGIGLSLSRRIMARLGGTLTLSARPITAFTIRL